MKGATRLDENLSDYDGGEAVNLVVAYTVTLTKAQAHLVERLISSVAVEVPSSMMVFFQLWGQDTEFTLPLPATVELCHCALLKVTSGNEPTLTTLKSWPTAFETA